MTKAKKDFLKRLAIQNRGKPPIIFEWEIIGEKGEILAILNAPHGDYAMHMFLSSEKGKKYQGAVSAVPKNEIKKGKKK